VGDVLVVSGPGLVASPGRHANLFALRAEAENGLRVVLLEAGQHGFTLVEPFWTMGRRGGDLWRVELAECLVPARQVLGGGRGLDARDLAELDGASRVREAAAAVGLAQAAFEAALRYSQQRSAFGVPICQHQAIQLKLADMATAIAVSRLLTQRAAGDGTTVPAGMAWLHSAETASTVTLESMRIHGGYGYTAEFPVERYYRDAAMLLARGPGGDEIRHAIARHAAEACRLSTGAP